MEVSGDARWFDGQACALVACGGCLETGCAAVAIATNERLRRRLGKQQDGEPRVRWAANGRQALHRCCWDWLQTLVGGGRRRGCRLEARMVREARNSAEFYDSHADVQAAARKVARLLLGRSNDAAGANEGGCEVTRRQLVVFTGAGVSEAAGIPTYRGTAGIDTKEELSHGEGIVGEGNQGGDGEDDDGGTDYTVLEPTLTHRAVAELEISGFVRFVVSQNCDNLHRKAGTSNGRLTEVHGNVFVEYCELCCREYTREYEVDTFSTDCHQEPWYVECQDCSWNHYTGRLCSDSKCRGRLRDTVESAVTPTLQYPLPAFTCTTACESSPPAPLPSHAADF